MKRLALLVLTLLAACSQVPAYRRPTVTIPPSFKEAPGWRVAAPSDAIAKGQWWLLLADPVLSDLETRVAAANQNVAQFAAAYAQARAAVREQRAAFFPTVDLSASGTRAGSFGHTTTTVIGTGTGTGGTGTGTGTGVGAGTGTGTTGTGSTGTVVTNGGSSRRVQVTIGASWEPDLWGRVAASVGQARGQAEAARADLANAVLSAQGELATDYVALRALDAQKRLLDDTIAAYAKALQITTNRYNAGVVARVDVLQASSQLRSARADAADLIRQRAIYEHAIAILIGENPSSFTLAPVADWRPTLPNIPSVLPSDLLERRPDIAAAERRVAAANQGIGIEKAAFFPTIGLSGEVGGSASGIGGLFKLSNSIWSLGVDGLLTLLDFGARSARVAQARAAWEQTVATYRQTVLTAFGQVEDNLAAARVLAQVATERRAAAEEASRVEGLVQNQYLAGQISYTDVITAQATALAAREQAVQAVADQQATVVALVQAIGGTWEGAFPPDSLLVPATAGTPLPC